MSHVHHIQIQLENLCGTCRYDHKCLRLQSIHKALETIEANSLDKWRMDVETEYSIKDCDLYSPDPDKLKAVAQEYVKDYMEDHGMTAGEMFEDRLAHLEDEEEEYDDEDEEE